MNLKVLKLNSESWTCKSSKAFPASLYLYDDEQLHGGSHGESQSDKKDDCPNEIIAMTTPLLPVLGMPIAMRTEKQN